MTGLLEALEAWAPASFLRSSVYVYPLLSAAHIISIGALVTSTALMDLRVIGPGRDLPVPTVIAYLRPVALLSLLLATITGLLLFSVKPFAYAENPAFRLKLLLILAALANAAAFSIWSSKAKPPTMLARVLAAISLLLWPAALVAGRFIGFLE